MAGHIIPFHCLVLCDADQITAFPAHERLSLASIVFDLVGDDRELRGTAFAELQHRVGLKLSLGQRVAVLADGLLDGQRRHVMALATAQGATVINMRGRRMPPLACPLPRLPLAYLRAHWKGITVVGDVHGDLAAMRTALEWGMGRQNFVWFLGDVIDYGSETLATSDAAYHAVMRGDAAMILGNHERKIARWLDDGGHRLRISEGNRVTINAVDGLKAGIRKQWVGRFRSLLAHASLMQQIDDFTLVHAAIHPTFWGRKPDGAQIEQFALYGEADHAGGKFRRVHRWIDAVPQGQTVLIGHDVMAPLPTIMTGALGGKVVFLDTGSGNGGHLSTADLRFTETGLHLECFNRH